MELADGYEALLAAAYVRGAARETGTPRLPPALGETPLEALTGGELTEIVSAGKAAGLKLHYFKRKDDLPRVTSVLDFLRGVQPESLLDVGSGRGAFLFPFLRDFPDVPVTAVDLLPRPEHIHLLTKEKLAALFSAAGCEKLKFGGTNGHLMAIASLNKGKEL